MNRFKVNLKIDKPILRLVSVRLLVVSLMSTIALL
jgi:hypothetical protein